MSAPRIALALAASVVASSLGQAALAQTPEPKSTVFVRQKIESYRVWAERAPGAQSDADDETPMLTVFRPLQGRPNGTAVVIAPGGGYIGLAGTLEGIEPATWFTARGSLGSTGPARP